MSEAPAAQAYVLRLNVPAAQLLTANQRYHWAEQSRRVKALKLLAQYGTRSYLNRGLWSPVPAADITVHLRWPDRRRRDPANWAPTGKALVDGVVAAGLLPDDDWRHVTGPDIRIDMESPMPPTRDLVSVELRISARGVRE